MKKKTIGIAIIVILMVFVIYLVNRDREIYYVNIGDVYITNEDYGYYRPIINYLEEKNKLERYVEFRYPDGRITDLIRAIEENDHIYVEGKKQTIQNALIKADKMTLWIGMNDLYYKLDTNFDNIYDYIDEMLLDYDTLFEMIRTYSKEQIIVLGLFNTTQQNQEYFDYINEKLEKLCNRYQLIWLSPEEIIKNDLEGKKISHSGYDKLGERILAKFTF